MKRTRKHEQYRHEWKYMISEGEKELILARMQPFFSLDRHVSGSGYLIRSLYFDDFENSAYEQKADGILERKKYRIRIYNYSDSPIRLERKKKYDSYIFKESAELTHEEYDRIMAGDYAFLLKNPQPLCREFYVECVSNLLRPRVIVEYDREPWFLDAGTVRITFDSHVRAAVGSLDLFDPALPCLSVLDPGTVLLEVKYTEFLPQVVRDILPSKAADMTAFSKFTMCCDKTMYLTAPDCYCEEGNDMPALSRAFAAPYRTDAYVFPH